MSMRAAHIASTSQTRRWWRLCAMLVFFLLLLCLHPQNAFGYQLWVTDMDGNVISSGGTVDINTLQEGYVLHCQYEDGESGVGGGANVLNETTGSLVGAYSGAMVNTDDGWHTSIYFTETLQPGTNYIFTLQTLSAEQVWSNATTISLTTSGGSSANSEEPPATTNTSQPDSGLDGTDAGDQTAETGSDETSSATSSTSGTASAKQVSVSVDGSSQAGTTVSGDGADDATQISGAGTAGQGSTYLALGSLGTVYSVEDETTQENQDVTSALSITGLPYLWVVLWVLLCAMLPVGLLSRYLGYRIGLARHSRLG